MAEGFFDRMLHRMAFSPAIRSFAERAQEARFGDALDAAKPDHPIFICGIPRAGSTILLQRLHSAPNVVSSLYRDMPFPTAPLWWNATAPQRAAARDGERAHGDGVRTGPDSPEAFDEVLWLEHWPEHFCHNHIALWREAERKPAFERDWCRWIAALAVLRKNGDETVRPVLKNNGHIARLRYVAALWPNAAIIVPYREPGQQAASLLNQHLRTIDRQQKNAFSRLYMDDLGHFEFGSGHRPIRFPTFTPSAHDPRSADYWLAYWEAAYRHVLDELPANAWLFDFDRACADPAIADRALATRIDDRFARLSGPELAPPSRRELPASAGAAALYREMRTHKRNLLPPA